MLFEDALSLMFNMPIALKDGKMGLLIKWCEGNEIDPDTIGVQVPGEESIRWLDVADVIKVGDGALIERG